MSNERCTNCGEETDPRSAQCEACGLPLRGASRQTTPAQGGIHRAAPIAFIVAGLAFGAAGTLLVNLTLGIPVGLMGGGIGVWMLERGRRLL